MSETLFLKNVYTNEVIAILKHVDLKSPLQNLRLRISSEITLLSNDAFEFIIAGTAIKKKQEQKYNVGVCAIRSADGKLYLDLTCRNPTATAVSIVADTVDTLTDQPQASQACFYLIYFKNGVIWILHIRVSYTRVTCK